MNTRNILAVVVLYENKIENSITLNSVNKALFSYDKLDVLIYDHSLISNQTDYKFEKINLLYKHDPQNIGLGVAYNYAATLAKKMGKKWILLLDQDTQFDKLLFEKYINAVNINPNQSLFVPKLVLTHGKIFSPCRYFFKRGFLLKKIEPGIHNLNYLSPVNSGMLIKIDNYIACGGYNENVKLDFSDFQFIERFKQFNSQFVLINSIGIQDFSNDTNDIEKLNSRYAIYCQSAKNCTKKNLFEKAQYMIVVLQRCITLSIRTKSKIYFHTFIKNYIQ